MRRLHAAGESRNSTARILGVTTRQVDNVAAEIGVSWSADATRDAVEVQRTTAEIARLELASKFRALASRALDRALIEDDTAEARRLTATAAEAARTDLHVWEHQAAKDSTTAGEDLFAALGEAFRVLDSHAIEDLDPDGVFECSSHPEDSPGWE